jgi:osmotically inducible protein OsmC
MGYGLSVRVACDDDHGRPGTIDAAVAEPAANRRNDDMQRSGKAVWEGDLKTGAGKLTTGSGVLKDQRYDFSSRFEDGSSTNPEELIGAAHAGCFAMAITAELAKAGVTPKRIAAESKITLDRVDGKPTVTRADLSVVAEVPGADRAQVQAIIDGAKSGCVISRLLNTEIGLTSDITV